MEEAHAFLLSFYVWLHPHPLPHTAGIATISPSSLDFLLSTEEGRGLPTPAGWRGEVKPSKTTAKKRGSLLIYSIYTAGPIELWVLDADAFLLASRSTLVLVTDSHDTNERFQNLLSKLGFFFFNGKELSPKNNFLEKTGDEKCVKNYCSLI